MTSHEEWVAQSNLVQENYDGSVKLQTLRKSIEDFKFYRELGEGSYSKVELAKDLTTGKLYAIKVLDKKHIVKEMKVKYVNIEKNALNTLGRHEGIIHLFYTLQNETSLYYVLEYAPNGDLLALIKRFGSLNENVVHYYGAQLLDALNFIHNKGIIHRDLKPENILLNKDYKVQITDFGTAKFMAKNQETGEFYDDKSAKSFVGTAEYVSPELLNNKSVGKPCDIWAYGCVIFQMIAGKPPFKASNEYQTFQQIMKLKYAFSAGFPFVIRDLVKRILVMSPSERLKVSEIKNHFFFRDIDWSNPAKSVWGPPHPEFGPYKISANSLKSVPDLTIARPKLTKPKSEFGVKPQYGSGSGTAAAAASSERKNRSVSLPVSPLAAKSATVSLSTAAAAVVSKQKITSEKHKRQSSHSSQKSPKSPPVTPKSPLIRHKTTNSVLMKSTKSGNSSPQLLSPVSPKFDPGPYKTVDLEWYQLLLNNQERIMKSGVLFLKFISTETFDKKFKGKIADSPLYYKGRRNNSNNNYSLLTHMVHGSNGISGLRNGGISGSNTSNGGSASNAGSTPESFGIIHHVRTEEVKKLEEELNNGSSGPFIEDNGVFKKFLSTTKNVIGNNMNALLEFKNNRMLLVTNLGRLLILGKKPGYGNTDRVTNNFDKYELLTEIDLTQQSIGIKELILDQTSYLNRSTVLGIFALRSFPTTVLFQVERTSLNSWTEALTSARISGSDFKLKKMLELDPSGKAGTLLGSDAALTAANLANKKA